MNKTLITRIKRRAKVKFARISKGIKYGVWYMKAPKNTQERLILRIVKMMVEKSDSVVFYSPEVGRIYIHTDDKKYIVVIDKYSVNISNHSYFYTYGVTDSLCNQIYKYAFRRLENDRKKLEDEMFFNERNFLHDLHLDLYKKHNKSTEVPNL